MSRLKIVSSKVKIDMVTCEEMKIVNDGWSVACEQREG